MRKLQTEHMPGTRVFVLLALLGFHILLAESILHNMATIHSAVLSRAAKVWHVYVRKFLHSIVNCTMCQKLCIMNEFLSFKTRAKQFVKYSKIGSKLDGKGIEIRKMNVSQMVTKASGSLTKTATGFPIFQSFRRIISSDVCRLSKEFNVDFHVSFYFALLNKYSINLTFLGMYFPHSSSECSKMGISIEQQSQTLNLSVIDGKYCGYHSSFSFYTFLQHIWVSVNFLPCSFIAVSAIFEILDAHIISSRNSLHKTVVLPGLQHIVGYLTSFGTLYKHTYHIEVNRIKCIQFNSSSFDDALLFTIFDGPGNLSPILHPVGNKSLTSSFQCYIEVLLSLDSFVHPIIFGSANFPNKSHIFLSTSNRTKKLHVPNARCVRDTCYYFVRANIGSQIKVFHADSYFSSTFSQTCKYGGLVVAEIFRNGMTEISVCLDAWRDLEQRNIYSQNSSLIIILYQYPPYSKIWMTLHLSATKCKVVQINPFILYTYCIPPQLFNKLCDLYLKEVTQFSGLDIQVTDENLDGSSVWLSLTLFPNQKECIVLQMIEKRDILDRYRLQINKIKNIHHLGISMAGIFATDPFIHYRQVNVIIYSQ